MSSGDLFRPPATLHDGRVVDTWSEEWRAECEARHVLNLPSKTQRNAYLATVERKRGQASRDALADLVMAIWRAGRTAGHDA